MFLERIRRAIVDSGRGRQVATALNEMMGGSPVTCKSAPRCFHLELENKPHARCPSCAFLSDTKL
jgi:hypothetical protein